MAPVEIPEEISEEELTDIGIEGGVEGGVIFGHHHLQAEVVPSIDSSTVPDFEVGIERMHRLW